MKVINRTLEPKSATTDLVFRKVLKRVLREWFDLRLQDLPIIIKKIGVEEQDYELTLSSHIESFKCPEGYFSIDLKRKYRCNHITFYRGTMLTYPYLTFDDERYYLGRTVTVEKINVPKVTTIAEQIYKDFMEH